ncbi:MAG: type II toxin-antitoxin system PemK/MazF family toxin [Candidatus Vogelbacteria bacterium]|nr:type II toxin-antitoxin system PemK/MazF family toxin [Candidatus Vogelbacteria bacterium]
MAKDYSNWHNKKTVIDKVDEERVFFHEREVWWCSIGLNVGFEQDGKGEEFARPVVVFKKFNKEVFWAIPLTTRNKTGRFYVIVDLGDNIERSAIISQLRLIDAKRLRDKFGVVNETDFAKIEKAIIALCQ